MEKRLRTTTTLLLLGIAFASPAMALQCDSGGLNEDTCTITSTQDISGEEVTDTDTDVIVDSGGRLYTDHAFSGTGSTNSAEISLKNGDFIVRNGGVVHANINISAFNIKIGSGGVIDASGLGYQAVPGKKSNCPTVETVSGFCTGYGPGGGGGGGSNSGTGSGGGGHAGKGGSYDDSGNSYTSSGGGRGPVKDSTYGTPEDPTTFGSAGGSFGSNPPNTFFLEEAASYTSTKANLGNAFQYSDTQRTQVIKNASHGFRFNGKLGKRDDPDHDLADSDRWHPDNNEYRINNPNRISMGAGGGRIKLVANNKLNNSGYILANGMDGMGTGNNGYPGSGGAGGSVWIAAGGVFGNGTVRAVGGDYAEFMDGGESNTGKSGVSAAGGGGYIYYEYSISEQDWELSASSGQGTVGLETDFSGNSNKQNPESRDLTATNGEITSQIAFSADVNETVVNPEEAMKVNGTASSTVTVSINGTVVGTTEPRRSDGFYNLTVEALEINSIESLGNYSMAVSSTISGKTITETFQISHRKIQISQKSDYIKKPGESFRVRTEIDRIKQDGSGGIQRPDYAGKTVDFSFLSGKEEIRSDKVQTNETGEFSLTDTIPATRGKKRYITSGTNGEGIKGSDRKNISWMKTNDTVVDPGQHIQINGTAYNTVSFELERPDGSFLDKGVVEPGQDGYFEVDKQVLTRSVIEEEQDLGNYTLRVQTQLNGETRTETWEISHREIEIENSPDFLMKSGEDLSFSDSAFLIKEDGSGGIQRTDYSDQEIRFRYINQSSVLESRDIATDASGSYSIFQEIEATRGLKRFTLETENQNGVDDTPRDNDLRNINNRSLGWVDVNDSVIDPGQHIQINGSVHNTVYISLEKPNGDFLEGSPIEPGSDGYFEAKVKTLTRDTLENAEDLGNYTLRVETRLNGERRSESFELSYREIEYYHSTDYLLRPGESFTVDGFGNLTKEDGSGGSKTVPLADADFNFIYLDGDETLRDSLEPTRDSGDFSVKDRAQPGEGLKRYIIEDINSNGITDLRADNDLSNTARKNIGTTTIDDFILNPGERLNINGTAYKEVEMSFNQTPVAGSPISPDPEDGFFTNGFSLPEFSRTDKLGNYTIRVNTSLNGRERSESFEVSLRGIRFDLDRSYPREVNPGEIFDVSGKALKYISDGSGGSQPINYSGRTISAVYTDENGIVQEKTTTTDENGFFRFEGIKSPLNAGDRSLTLSTENPQGIRHSRTEVIETRIRVENSSSTSPSKRLFKDSNLDQTRFINPSQNVKFGVDTRKSIDFVKRVYANITLPDGTSRQVELDAQNVLGEDLRTSEDWDSGKTTHLTHTDLPGTPDSDKLRLGYERNTSDKALLNMPMEGTSGEVTDISGGDNDGSPSGSISRGQDGVFSTKAIGFSGGSIEITDSTALNLQSNFTVSAWINTPASGTVYSRASNAGGDMNPELRIDEAGKAVMEISNDGTATTVKSSEEVDDGQWYHIAGRYNTTHISLYVDGDRQGSVEVNAEPPEFQRNTVIGDSGTFESRPFDGRMDELKIFNSSLEESRIERLGSTDGSFITETVETGENVKDILKLVNFEGRINSQELKVEVLSDYDSDGAFEETSEPVQINQETDIESVKGLTNFSSRFRLNISFDTADVSRSPVVSRLDLKARKDQRIKWTESRSIKEFFAGQYGLYRVDYGSSDYGGTVQDTFLEESNFTVRNIALEADHRQKADPGEKIKVTGNATVITGDGNGGKNRTEFTGNLNLLFDDTVRGRNQIQESRKLEGLGTGETRDIPVNGTQSPEDAEITFFGQYSGTDEKLVWNSSQDWDSFQSRTGTIHSKKEDSQLDNTTLTLGYPSVDLGGDSLSSYYAMDDASLPLDDSTGKTTFQAAGSPTLESEGVLNTQAVELSGDEGFSSSTSPFRTTGSFTVNAWIKPESLPVSEGRLGSGSGSPYTVFSVKDALTLQITRGGNVYAETNVGGESFSAETTSGSIEAGEWNMVTLVYNTEDDGFSVSTGLGADSTSTTVAQTPDLTEKPSYIGYRPDIDSNGFRGKIDELRIYSRAGIPFNLRNVFGDKTEQQQIQTGQKSFSEQVRTGSLVLEADAETNGQKAQITVKSNQGGSSDPVKLSDDQERYPLDGEMADAQKFSLKVEMDSNVTDAPRINSLNLVRRFATENPGVDIDRDGQKEAGFTGRILPGQSRTVGLENLSEGINKAEFSSLNGRFGARINYTEVLVRNKKPEVEVNSSGRFSAELTVPQFSGTSSIEYYTTNKRGIQGLTQTELTTSLSFTSATVSDLQNGDRTIDPEDRFQVNATLARHRNPIEEMKAVIKTPTGTEFERELRKTTYPGDVWNLTEDIGSIYDREGTYTVRLQARDTKGLTELKAPQLSFNVTNGKASIRKSEEVLGLGRNLTVNGTIRQSFTGESAEASVNITVPATGERKNIDTGQEGFYSTTVSAPKSTGTYNIKVESLDEDGISATNSTAIEVEDTTSIQVSVPESKVPIRGVTLDSGTNISVPVNITNTGDTDVRNIEVYGEKLPDASQNSKILQGRDGRDWRSVNQTYNIDSGARETVEAVIDVSKASTQADYTLNISTLFKTTGGVTKTTTDQITMSVTLSKLPLFQKNLTVTREDGYTGNFIPPDGTANLTLENQGTGIAQDIGWEVENPIFREAWIDRFFKARNGSYARGTGGSIRIFDIEGKIPEGTPPGTYSTLLSSYSKDPDRTNSANFTVNVENSPKWRPVIKPLDEQVTVPEEINASNPVRLGNIDLDSREDLLNLTLMNTGNRDLEWEIDTLIAQGDDSNIFYANRTSVPNHGSETFSSSIESLGEYRYRINSPTTQIGYTTEFATNIETDYSANISIQCVSPSGCGPGEVKIPVKGTVKDPAPRFSDLEIPGITGRGNAVFVNGTVSDNDGTTNTQGLREMEIILTKYLDTEEKEIRVGNQDFNIKSPQGTFSEKIVPSKLGRDLDSNDHSYGIRLKAVDINGNTRTTREYNFTVRDRADLDLTLNRTDITLQDVTDKSGDTAQLSGTVTGGRVDTEDASLTLSIGETDPGTADERNINFTSQDSFIDLGDIQAGENVSFNAEIQAAPNTGFIADYFAGVTPAWTNPDGSTESGSESTATVSAARNIGLDITGTDTVVVPHNSSRQGSLTVTASGNAPVNDIGFECIGCTSLLGITEFNSTGFSLDSGESREISYTVSADRYIDPRTVQIDIRASSERKDVFLNDTTVTVPEERAIKLSPENQSEVLPADQGVVNVTELSLKNTGNVPLEPLTVENPVNLRFYLGESQVDPFSTTILPGETVEVNARSDTDEIEPLGDEPYNFTVDPSSSTALDELNTANITLFVQDIGLEIRSQNTTQNLVSEDIVKTEFNLTKDGEAIPENNSVDITLRAGGKELDINESYSNDTGLWTSRFQAPNIEDGINHSFLYEASSSQFRSSITASNEVSYRDVTPPRFSNLTAEPVKEGENSTIEVKVDDNSNIAGQDVTANVILPDDSTEQIKLDPIGSTRLGEQDSRSWTGEFNSTPVKGLYNVTVKATDLEGNTGKSGNEYFRVFRPLNVSGDAGEPAESTEIRLIDEGGDVAETVDPEDGEYNETVRSGSYSQAQVVVTEEKIANIESLSAGKINQSPPKFDARINDNQVNVEKQYLSGFGVVSETLENISGGISFDYSSEISEIDFQGNLQVMKCEDYNISKAVPCQSGYETVSKQDTFIDAQSQNLFVDDISGFSSYILVEDESSSEEDSLNVNLTGEIGNLEGLSDLSNLDSLLQEVASNTEDSGSSTDGSEGDTGGGGSSSTGSGGTGGSVGGDSSSDALDEIASQLNESESEELSIGNSKISVSVQPGQQKSTAVSIQNPRSETVEIELESTRNIESLLSYEENFELDPGEFRTVRISVDASNRTRLKEYSGFIQISGGETDRSIPVNIDIVGAENRLLDVSLDPTVDSFQPGKTARLKLSFSNQGFTRAVDAETTVEVVDITDDEVVARKTNTYAVQTTLDKVVSLNIPEDTDLGTYEARASVAYSNVPGNRSATAVGQVQVEEPFWERQTLGVSNTFWAGILLSVIITGSGAGYLYYRRKREEEKRKRFEEQVDNGAIPSEEGRTAFIGELSEIGTRAFINLNDLMTHCLTAGATGAGKSVAAQVAVEEALEQGVNVIVLDPTGQWSGYLNENEDESFFAFYNDFGMKQGDARGYDGNIRAVDPDQDTIDITDVLRPEGDEGTIHVFSMHKLENAELEEYLSDTIQQIFDHDPEEKDELKTLLVYDEAHRVLEKFGGTGRGVKMLERGAREFRKWGTGMLMISQVIDDFPEEVRANVGTQIQMRTEYEGDLDRIERKYGNNIAQGVTKADTGTGMVQNSSYNHGRPYFVDFRPVKHSPERLSDEKLEKFEKYNRRVDQIEDMISILEDQGEDVFEYRSQLKLVKKNIRKESFNLVDTYLNELEEDLDEALDL